MNLRTASLLLIPVFLAACEDDGSGPNSGDQLTRAEAILLAGELSGAVETTAGTPEVTIGQDGAAAAAGPITFTRDQESTHPCPGGGTVSLQWRITGTADFETGSFTLDVDGTNRPAGCQYLHDGTTLTISGDPDLDFSAHAATVNYEPTEPFTAGIEGAFSWSASDGRSGQCLVDYQAVTDFAAKQRTVEGSVCGHSIAQTLSWK